MMDVVDISGKRFGMLTAVRHHPFYKSKGEYWDCVCDCGVEIIVQKINLRRFKAKSCGCTNVPKSSEHRKTHGMKDTRLYSIWLNIKSRTNNPNNKAYSYYGGKGVFIHKDWIKFENFMEWALHNGYSEQLTIDRIDSNDGYTPGNCRWVSMKVQSRNKSNSIRLEYNGETKTLVEHSEDCGLKYDTVLRRFHKGLSVDHIFSKRLVRGGNLYGELRKAD